MFWMPLKSYKGPWVPLSPDETVLRDALRRDVRFLAEDIGDRNWLVYPRLLRAAEWIEASLAQAGYKVRRLGFDVRGRRVDNLEVEISAALGRRKLSSSALTTTPCLAVRQQMTTRAGLLLSWLWPGS